MSFIHDIYEFRKSFRHIEKLTLRTFILATSCPFEKCRRIKIFVWVNFHTGCAIKGKVDTGKKHLYDYLLHNNAHQ